MNRLLPNLSRNAAALLGRALALAPGEPPRQVLLELKGDYPLVRPGPPIPLPLNLGPRPETLGDLRRRLERLADAPDIEGIVLVIRSFGGGLATAHAVRDLLARYRARGKTVTAYAETVDNRVLYLASVADRFVALENGEWTATGLAARVVFLRDALEKIGLEPEFERRAEYKSAAERFTERGFSEANREAVSALLDDLHDHWLGAVAAGRGLEPDEVREAVDAASPAPADAVDAGLADGLAYEDEVAMGAKPWLGAARFAPPRLGWDAPQSVAVVSLQGLIVPGESRTVPVPLPLVGGAQAGGTTIARAIRTAAQDEAVKAIVVHVDSGGGSALASEVIWRELERARRAKPVVAVMGDVAASGGYYVLCGADRVFAAPTTVTGSIGVIAGKFSAARLWERLGFHPETIKRGEFADFGSPDRPASPAERERLVAEVDRIYATFKRRVAEGRGLSDEAVEEVARGRVWSGRRALELGLVDELGTPFDAVAAARRLAGLPEDAPVYNVTPPPRYVAPTDLAAAAKAVASLARPRVWARMPFDLELS